MGGEGCSFKRAVYFTQRQSTSHKGSLLHTKAVNFTQRLNGWASGNDILLVMAPWKACGQKKDGCFT